MAVVAVGLNQRKAPLELFEKVAVSERDLPKVLGQLTDSQNISEAVVVSTCLRTEIYAVVERFHEGVSDIGSWLRARMGDDPFASDVLVARSELPELAGGVVDLGGPFVCWYDDAAAAHLFEVAAGIDSPVLGEGEVLRQVGQAAERARVEHCSGPVLAPLFRHAVEAGKRARHETAIQRGTTSLAHAAVELAADHALGLDRKGILVIGAGEMGEGIARALAGRGDLTGEVVVANRGSERRRSVADLVAGRAVSFASLPEEVARADVILTSTSSGELVLGQESLEPLLAGRQAGRPPLVIVDAAVPRDVEPEVSSLAGVRLLDMEDIRRYAERHMESRVAEVPAVRAILGEELERYRVLAVGRLAAPVVSALREKADNVRASELERHRARLDGLDERDRELVERITRRVVSKLLHEPTVRIKDAAGSPRGERLAEALRILFDL